MTSFKITSNITNTQEEIIQNMNKTSKQKITKQTLVKERKMNKSVR